MKKLKDLLNESVLGELPSSKMFKYNKTTGKYEAPGQHTNEEVINEAEGDDPSKEHVQDIIQAIVDFEDRLNSEYGSNASTELHKISNKFINDLRKLANKYK